MTKHFEGAHFKSRDLLDDQLRAHVLREGVLGQIIQTCEEMGELAQSLSKLRRGKCSPFQVAKELSDVSFMMSQVPIIVEELTGGAVTPENFRAWVEHELKITKERVLES